MTAQDKMKYIKSLVGRIPDSPYGWKMTSEKKRAEIITKLVDNMDKIMALDLPSIIEGELYEIQTANSSQTFDALRSIKKVMMDYYFTLKNQ